MNSTPSVFPLGLSLEDFVGLALTGCFQMQVCFCSFSVCEENCQALDYRCRYEIYLSLDPGHSHFVYWCIVVVLFDSSTSAFVCYRA